MIGVYNFNEGSTTQVLDYAGNGNDSTSVTGLAIDTGEVGNVGRFDGATTEVNLGNINDFGGIDTISVFIKQKKKTAQKNVFAFKSLQFEVRLNVSDKVVFIIYIGSSAKTLTSTESIDTSFSTIGCVYDGVNQFIYIDGVLDSSQAQTGNIDSNSNNLLIGSDTSFFYDGDIEHIEFNTIAYTSSNITEKDTQPSGIKYEHYAVHEYTLGDLLEIKSFDRVRQGVVTFVESTLIAHVMPVKGRFLLGDIPIRRGNNGFDTTRQWRSEYNIISGQPILTMYNGINTFASPGRTNRRAEISPTTIAQDNIDLLKLALLGN